LQSPLVRARQRVENCVSELARFESYATSSEHDQALLCRLARDLRLAEADLRHLEAPQPPADYVAKEEAMFDDCGEGELDRWQPPSGPDSWLAR
jgi:hypothetical protein